MATLNLTAASISQSNAAAEAARPGVARWSVAAWVLLFWFGFYGLMMPSDMIEDMQMAHGANLSRDVFGTVLQALVWSLFSPLILWLTQHYAIEGPKRWRSIGVHAASGLLISAVNVAICHSAIYALFGDRIGSHVHWSLAQSVVVSTPYLMVIYLAFAAIVYSIRLVRRYEEREKLLAQAQVQALKAQLN